MEHRAPYMVCADHSFYLFDLRKNMPVGPRENNFGLKKNLK